MLQVSVIVPTYNRATYLSLALQSVLDQSLTPYEIVVIDDGSTDDTENVVRAFGSKVRYFSQDHKGVSAARNLGLQASQGEVIAWLDADDLWEPDFLKTVVSALEEDLALDGVYTGCCFIDAAGSRLSQLGQKVVPPSNLFEALVEGNFIATPALVMRKKCFAQMGEFDTRLHICEDYDMWLRLADACMIKGLPTPLVQIRVHKENTVQNIDAFCRYRLAVIEKHFGPMEGEPANWTEMKQRAYAMTFREVALRKSSDITTEQKWSLLEKGATIWPNLLTRLDTFYELACDTQPRGYRGQGNMVDLEKNREEMLEHLGHLFVDANSTIRSLRGLAYGNAYLALGMLADQAGQWGLARTYLIRAIGYNAAFLYDAAFIRRLVKLCAGKHMIAWVQHFRSTAVRQRIMDT